jgi:predicted transport protein
MELDPPLQTKLYTAYWRPMEMGFGQAGYAVHFDRFMRNYLTAKTGEIPNVGDVYTAFKAYARDRSGDTQELVAEIHAYADYYCAMALGKEKNPLLREVFHDIRELKMDVVYPFLLEAYHDYRCGDLSAEELHEASRLAESYVFRRAVCAIPTNSLNRIFAGLSRSVKKDRYVESLTATFLLLPSYRRFPADDEFQRELKVRNLYKFRSLTYWLRRLENHGRKEPVAVDSYTVEHILPQNPHLSEAWKQELGTDHERVHQTWLHTLGNLTLTGYNSEYSDRPFKFKRDEALNQDGDPVGFKASPLILNQGLGSVATWDEEAIRHRGDRLAARATKVWRAPNLPPSILDAYRPVVVNGGQKYTIADHQQFANVALLDLFEQLRASIRALDPCVSEEVLKIYIAYKAETNFVDVIPQAKRLLLSLNIPFHEIDDPNGLCRDVTSLGRWGNGDVEVKLESTDQLPYVMGLIRQAFAQQMGSVDV